MKVELAESPTREEVSKAWPDDVQYKGQDIFNTYIDALNELGKCLGIGSESEYDEEIYDGEIDEWYTETLYEVIDGQESYLGYIPSIDKFISGWDIHNPDDVSGVVMFSFNNLKVSDMAILDGYKNMMYYSTKWQGHKQFNSNLEKLESEYPGIIHVRLD